MQESEELQRVGMLVQDSAIPSDIASVLETEGILEYLYALVAVGEDLDPIAAAMRLPMTTVRLIMRSSAPRRAKLLEARQAFLAEGSMETLESYMNKTDLDKQEAAGALHHRSMVKLSGDLLKSNKDESEAGPQVIVHANTYVGDVKAPPPLPPELKGTIIDVDPRV